MCYHALIVTTSHYSEVPGCATMDCTILRALKRQRITGDFGTYSQKCALCMKEVYGSHWSLPLFNFYDWSPSLLCTCDKRLHIYNSTIMSIPVNIPTTRGIPDGPHRRPDWPASTAAAVLYTAWGQDTGARCLLETKNWGGQTFVSLCSRFVDTRLLYCLLQQSN